MIEWMEDCPEGAYRAAEDYLLLHFARETARGLVGRMRYAPVEWVGAENVLRAARLEPIHARAEGPQAPILLVRSSVALIVADGYDRVCAAALGGNVKIPVKIV
jgi:hypothetical protein